MCVRKEPDETKSLPNLVGRTGGGVGNVIPVVERSGMQSP
jgi:hypothetical protein